MRIVLQPDAGPETFLNQELVLVPQTIWVVIKIRVPFRVLFIRVPYYIGDQKRDPNLENYPYNYTQTLYQLALTPKPKP